MKNKNYTMYETVQLDGFKAKKCSYVIMLVESTTGMVYVWARNHSAETHKLMLPPASIKGMV
jgi:hypothetical protein